MNDAEKVNMTILEEWIAGKGKHPVTWTTLTETLRDTALNELAGEIAAVKTAHSKAQLGELDRTAVKTAHSEAQLGELDRTL